MAVDFKPKSTSTIQFKPKVQQPVTPIPKGVDNWASNVPGLKQIQDFGLGIGSAIGTAGLGLGQSALKTGMFVGDVMNKIVPGSVDNSLAQKTVDILEKGKQNIYQKPIEKNLQSYSGVGGQVVGNLAPYFSGGMASQVGKLSFSNLLPRAVKAAPYAIPDMVVAAGQSGGDVKTTLGTGFTSLVGGSILPSASAPIRNKILTGTATGYTGDVAMGLAGQRGEEREGGKAFIPGAGTVLGTGFGTLTAIPQIKQQLTTPNIDKIVTKRTNALNTVVGQRGPLYKTVEKAKARGLEDPIKYIADTDILVGAVDKNGTINSKQALENFRDVVSPIEGTVRKALEQENKTVNLNQLLEKLREAINASRLEGSLKLKAFREAANELQGLALSADAEGNIPLTLVHDAKVTRGSTINYLDPEKSKTGKIIVNALKEFVENNTDSINVKQFNEELSKLYSVRDILRQLNNRKVEGGRLGKYFASAIGSYIGGQTGGPLGAIAGAEVGAKLRGEQMSRALGGKTGKEFALPQRLIESLPQSNKSGSLNTTQSTTITPTVKDIQEKSVVMPSSLKNQPSPSTKSTILDRANKSKTQGGYVVLPFSKKQVKAIDAQTKKDILEAMDYLKSGEYNRGKQVSFDALTRKYEIPVDSLDQTKVLAYMRKLLDRTKTPETLPATYTRKPVK